MGYVGVPPQSGFITTAKQRVTSSTNNYVDLDHSISSLADVIVWVNFVKQDSTNLSLTTSTRITLGATLVASDIVEIAYLGKAVATQTPDTGTVTNDMLAGSIANDKLAGSIANSKLANSSITLNGSAVSLGGSATVNNTPAFSAQMGFNQEQSVSDGVVTKAEVDTEYFDTNSAFDTSNYRFTIPSGEQGNYLFSWGLYCYAANTSSNIQYCNATIRKNGSDYIASGYDFRDNEIRSVHFGQSAAFNVAAGDYFELWGQIKVNSGTPSFYGGARQTFFGAMKILT